MRPMREMFMTQRKLRSVVFPAAAIAVVAFVAAACGELTGPESPSTPTGVIATLTGPTSATITWTPSPLNDGVISYSVFRNGAKIGESTTTSYVDTGLSPQTTYVYSIAANCLSGIVSDRSVENAASTVTTVDLTPPTVISNQPPANFVGVSPAATVTATFSEGMDPATINATTFTLRVTGGAAIAGAVTYNQATRTATFTPASSLPNPVNFTATITTGARDLAGNALAAPFSWTFTTRDDTGPTVVATSPAAGATGVSPGTAVNITFSEALDATTINATNITMRVTSSGAAVPGTVTYNAATRVATFTPAVTLAQTTSYTVTVAAAVRDVAGNPMVAPFTFAFTTADTNAPSVTAVAPLDNALAVAVATTVQLTFSEAMDQSTINTTNIKLRNTSTSAEVAGTVSYNPNTNVATFTPSGPLSNATNYTVTVTTEVKDVAGNRLASQFMSDFTTAALADVTPPSIVSRSPTNGATNVPINTNATVTFNEPMDSATINAFNITLTPTAGGAAIAATVTCTNSPCTTAMLDPTPTLANNTSYTLTVTTEVKDRAGNRLAATPPTTFTTAQDTTSPTVISRTPTAATGVADSVNVTFTFSEDMDPVTINGTTVTLNVTAGGAPVTGLVSYNALTRVATFNPSAALAPNTNYTATVTTGARDTANNPLAPNSFSTFTFTTAP